MLGTILGLKLITGKIPGALIAVIGAIFISWKWDLASHGVATLGPLPSGLPTIGLPDVSLSDIPALMGTAVSIFVLVLAQSAATSRAYAAKYNDHFDENVDLVGLSAASAMAGISGTFVVNGSPTKTQMVDGAGGTSQFAQLTTAVIVAIVLLFLTAPIQYMPKAVLSSVVFLIGVELVDLAGMRKVLRLRPDEFVVATLVALTVVCVGVEQGIVLAIVASVIDHMRRSYRPTTSVMQPAAGGRLARRPGGARPPERTGARRLPVRRQHLLRQRQPVLRTGQRLRHLGEPTHLDLPRRSRHPGHRLQRRRDDPPAPRRAQRRTASSSSSPSRWVPFVSCSTATG